MPHAQPHRRSGSGNRFRGGENVGAYLVAGNSAVRVSFNFWAVLNGHAAFFPLSNSHRHQAKTLGNSRLTTVVLDQEFYCIVFHAFNINVLF